MDGDSFPNVQYVIVGANNIGSDGNAFTINTQGDIFSKAQLNYETKSFYQFTVTTTDGENTNTFSSSATVRITVLVWVLTIFMIEVWSLWKTVKGWSCIYAFMGV